MLIAVVGILLILSGSHTLISGARVWRGTTIPTWTAWPEIILGIIVLLLAIWNLRRKEKMAKRTIRSDEEASRAKAELDAMYLRDHGTLPEKPEKD